MNENFEIMVCGAEADRRSTDRVHFVSASCNSVDELRADELNSFVSSCQTQFFGFVDNQLGFDTDEFLEQFEYDAESALLLPFGDNSFAINCWRNRTQRFASLIAPPEQHAVVIIDRNAVETFGPFDAVLHPIWNWCIRCVRDGGQISALPRPLGTTPTMALSALAPPASEVDLQWLLRELQELSEDELLPSINSPVDAIALHSGLLLVHDYLDESHDLSQSIEGQGANVAGDYWHAIMHRREPDYSNSKYWYRRVGRHPIFDSLAEGAGEILESCSSSTARDWQSKLGIPQQWDPSAMVDLCSACESSSDNELISAARRIQQLEMQLLLTSTGALTDDCAIG